MLLHSSAACASFTSGNRLHMMNTCTVVSRMA
jgi:hypothetical protein